VSPKQLMAPTLRGHRRCSGDLRREQPRHTRHVNMCPRWSGWVGYGQAVFQHASTCSKACSSSAECGWPKVLTRYAVEL